MERKKVDAEIPGQEFVGISLSLSVKIIFLEFFPRCPVFLQPFPHSVDNIVSNALLASLVTP